MKAKQSQKSKLSEEEKKMKKWLKAMEEDVPTCYSPSISSLERNSGHGFWGNPASGYIYDKTT